jgi:ADP-ribosylglycohydrolase
LGGALGDALGAPIEFDRLAEIRERFGPSGLTQLLDTPAHITDDTQMTLFTAEGLLAARGDDVVHAVHRAYLTWLLTQGFEHALLPEPVGQLVQARELWARRAPGNTCLLGLMNATTLGQPAQNDSKGCGTVMRMAPVGLAFDPEAAFRLGSELSALTHGHPTGILAGGYFAAVVSHLTRERSLPSAIEESRAFLQSDETLRAIDAAVALADSSSEPNAEAVETLGGGWIAEEALAIALYSALVARDFTHGVLLAVNHSGDSDSTGSMAGNLLGAIHGHEALPRDWLEQLELRDTIERVARELVT